MKLNNNLTIIFAAVLLTAAVFVLVEAGSLGLSDYIGIAALIGGLIGLYFGYRFLMAYFGKGKKSSEPKFYAELRPYDREIASGSITLFFSLPEEDNVRLQISDLSGNVLKILKEERLAEGEYPVTFDTSVVDNGTYFYELSTSNYRNSKKLIIRN